MTTTLGADRIHIEDTPSETVRRMRLDLNALTDFVLLIVNAALTDGDTFRTNVDALDMTTIRRLVASRERPAPPEVQ
jgi:uncharacterized protein YfkK (UPF0435 family)